jgi:polysaccharide biosynthesis protein PslF
VPLSVAILSTFPPTQCGLASFSSSLVGVLAAAGDSVGVVRMVDAVDGHRDPRVVHQMVRDSRSGLPAVLRVLDEYDLVIVQHEYGIYGGADGRELIDLLDAVNRPVIVVAHTVLSDPSPHQREVLERVADRADAVVAMTMTARRRLVDGYRVDPGKVVVIPHGVSPRPGPAVRRPGPPRLLTWGLLGPGKGIEFAIDALAALGPRQPAPGYHVVGQTHPRVLARDGEAYRTSLRHRADAHGVGDRLTFEPAYVAADELARTVADADVVVLPYESREQVTSGVLVEAVAAGRPVVATAFPHAVELLAGGAGTVVPHDDVPALAAAIRRVLTEPGVGAAMAARASGTARAAQWHDVGRRYHDLGADLVDAGTAVAV